MSLDPFHPALITGLVVLAFIGLLSGLSSLSNIIRNHRRNPPLAEELAEMQGKVLALQDKLEGMEHAIDGVPAQVAILTTQATSLDQRLSDARKATADSEGRMTREMEKMEKQLTEHRSNSERRFGELGTKVDTIASSMQALHSDVLRSLGRLEGASAMIESAAQRQHATS